MNYILCGVSGSGKSTWASELVKNDDRYIRINRDDIRKTLYGDLTNYYKHENLNERENIVNVMESCYLSVAKKKKKFVIVDNTNLKINHITKWKRALNNYTQVKVFEAPLHKLKIRVGVRDYDYLTDVVSNDVLFKDDLYYNIENIENLKYIDKQYEVFNNNYEKYKTL